MGPTVSAACDFKLLNSIHSLLLGPKASGFSTFLKDLGPSYVDAAFGSPFEYSCCRYFTSIDLKQHIWYFLYRILNICQTQYEQRDKMSRQVHQRIINSQGSAEIMQVFKMVFLKGMR